MLWDRIQTDLTSLREASPATLHEWLLSNRLAIVGGLAALAADPVAVSRIAIRSYLHANGFVKLVLCESGAKLRLHMWTRPGPEDTAGSLHNHRWNLASVILRGAMLLCTYEVEAYARDENCEMLAFTYRPVEGSTADLVTPAGRAGIRLAQVVRARQGSSFSCTAPTVHYAEAIDEPTVTLVVHGSARRDETNVYRQNDEKFPGRTAITEAMVRSILTTSLQPAET